jgi:hypothetical protein
VRDAFTHAHGDCNCDSHSNCGNFGDAYSNGYGDSNSDAYADSDFSDAQTSADSAAAALACSGIWKR